MEEDLTTRPPSKNIQVNIRISNVSIVVVPREDITTTTIRETNLMLITCHHCLIIIKTDFFCI